MIMNHGYEAPSNVQVRPPLTVKPDVFQKDDVPDCYGISVDRLPNTPLYLRYTAIVTM